MDMATQPCTQPLGGVERPVADTRGILCVLYPTTECARSTVTRLLHTNREFVFVHNAATSKAPKMPTSDEELDDEMILSIALRFRPGPKSPGEGFLFGRTHQRCDVVIGNVQNMRRISSIHFKIYVNDDHALMLEDMSTNGTYVDKVYLSASPVHSLHAEKPMHLYTRVRQLNNGSEIHILKGKGPVDQVMRFMVRIPRSDGSGFIGDQDNNSTFNDTPQVQPTAGPSGYLNFLKTRKTVPVLVQGNQQQWVMCPRYLLLDAVVGRGAFTTVHKAMRKGGKEVVAVKIIARRPIARNVDRNKNTEVDILDQLVHPNIVEYHEYLEDDGHLYIVMEYIPGGDLEGYLLKHGRMEESLVKDVTRQVLRGIKYIHERDICHRNLKPGNILVVTEDPMIVKIGGFGQAERVREGTFLKTFCGTLFYLAPEGFPRYHMGAAPVSAGSKRKHDALEPENPKPHGGYNQAMDLWSIGCLTFVLLTGRPPFDARHVGDILSTIMTEKFDVEALWKAGVGSERCVDFLSSLLKVDPSLRMKEDAALCHPWLAQDGKDDDGLGGDAGDAGKKCVLALR